MKPEEKTIATLIFEITFVVPKTGREKMGSAGSRPRLRKVAPCRSLQEERGQHKAQWTLPALPVTAELPSGSLGQRKTTLPPLKQEITLSTLSG